MSSEEVKIQRSKSRKRNIMAKVLRDQGDHKGAFSIKVIDSRKGEYKRKRMRVTEDYGNEEDY